MPQVADTFQEAALADLEEMGLRRSEASALAMCFMGNTTREAAAVLNCSQTSIRKHVGRGAKKLAARGFVIPSFNGNGRRMRHVSPEILQCLDASRP